MVSGSALVRDSGVAYFGPDLTKAHSANHDVQGLHLKIEFHIVDKHPG